MLKQAEDISKRTLNKLVIFCTRDSVCSEMRAEVLKVAARGIAFGFGMDLKITLSIQGWGDPELFAVDGHHFVEIAKTEEKIGTHAPIVSVQQYKFKVLDKGIVKQILAHEDHHHSALAKLELSKVKLYGRYANPENPLLTLMKASKEWRVEILFIENIKDIWATLARMANTGGIRSLLCKIGRPRWLNDVDLGDVRKMWEISEEVGFQTPDWVGSLDVLFSMGGGRSIHGALEENWQVVVNAAQTIEDDEDEECEKCKEKNKKFKGKE